MFLGKLGLDVSRTLVLIPFTTVHNPGAEDPVTVAIS